MKQGQFTHSSESCRRNVYSAQGGWTPLTLLLIANTCILLFFLVLKPKTCEQLTVDHCCNVPTSASVRNGIYDYSFGEVFQNAVVTYGA